MEYLLNKLLEYERKILEVDGVNSNKIGKILDMFKTRYIRTLKARPWEKCLCPICKENGVNKFYCFTPLNFHSPHKNLNPKKEKKKSFINVP